MKEIAYTGQLIYYCAEPLGLSVVKETKQIACVRRECTFDSCHRHSCKFALVV